MPDAPAPPTPTTPSNATPAPAPAPQTPAAQPQSTPAGQAPAQPTPDAPAAPAAPEGPKEPPRAASVREAKQQLRRGGDRYPSTAAEARAALGKGEHHAQTQPRAEDGKFAAQEPSGDATPDLNASGEPTLPATPPDDATATTQPAEPEAPKAEGATDVPEGMVRIDIPKGHPAWEAGREFALVPKEHEKYHRWAINNAVRREHVAQWEQHAKGVENENRRLKAELEAAREFTGGIFNDPAVVARVQEIRQAWGDEEANRYLAGLQAEQQAKVQELTQKQEAEAQQAEKQTYVQNFMRQAYGEAEKRFPGITPQEIGTAIAAYGSYVEARNGEQLDLNEFLKHAAPLALQNPQVRAEAERRRNARLEQERQASAKAEADRLAAEERKKLEEAAAKRAQYPWMQVPAGAVPAQVGVDEGAGGPRNVHEARRSLRRLGRSAARA